MATSDNSGNADDASVDALLAAAVHEMRQPIQALRLVESAAGSGTAGERRTRLGRAFSPSLDLLDDTLASLVDYHRMLGERTAGAVLQPVALPPLLTMLERETRAILKTYGRAMRLVACSAVVLTDADLLRSLLRNLVSHMARQDRDRPLLLGCRRRGGRLHIELRAHRESPTQSMARRSTGLLTAMRIGRLFGDSAVIRWHGGGGTGGVLVDVPISATGGGRPVPA